MKAGMAFLVVGAVCIILSFFVTWFLLIPGIIFLVVGAALLYVESKEAKGALDTSKKVLMDQEKWQCFSCGYLNFADTAYCGKCGQKRIEQVEKNWFCQECGRENQSGTVFCGKCGQRKR